MKKIILLAAVAALAMTSCSKDQAIQSPNNSGDAISFKPLGTKATETTTLTIADFKVYTYYDNGSTPETWADLTHNFMNGVEVYKATSPATGWVYDQVKYWPTEGLLHFLAYSPYASTLATFSGANEAPSVAYTVGATVTDQEDFIVAKALNEERHSIPAGDTKPAVALEFSHALSQIAFQARSGDALIFNISEIEIINVNNEGTYNFTGDDAGKWTNKDGAETYAAELTAAAATIEYSTTAYTPVTGSDAILMLLPQTLVPGDANPVDVSNLTGTYLRVAFTAMDKDDNNVVFGTTADPIVRLIPLGDTWVSGKKYVYQLELKGASGSSTDLDPIVFSNISVTDWVTPDDEPDLNRPVDL